MNSLITIIAVNSPRILNNESGIKRQIAGQGTQKSKGR